MSAIPYTITNLGDTTLIGLTFTFVTPVELELHADFSSIKTGEESDFTGTEYTITGLNIVPTASVIFTIDYTRISGGAGILNGSVNVTGTSNVGSDSELVATKITIIQEELTSMYIIPTSGSYAIDLTPEAGSPRTDPPPPPPIAPVADFVGSPLSGLAPLTVNFTDLSTNTPTDWYWTFGNGQTSYDQNPSTIYNPTVSQTFNVSLSVFNEAGSDSEIKNAYISVDAWPEYVEYRLQQTEMSFQDISCYGDGTNDGFVNPPGEYNYTIIGDNPCDYIPGNEPPTQFMNAAYSGKIKLKRMERFFPFEPWGVKFDTSQPAEQLLYTGNYDNVIPLAQQYFAGYIPTPIPISGVEYEFFASNVSKWTNSFTMYYIECPPGETPGIGPYPARQRISMSGTQSRVFITKQAFVTEVAAPTTIVVTHLSSGTTKNYTLDMDYISFTGGSDDGYTMLGYYLRYYPST